MDHVEHPTTGVVAGNGYTGAIAFDYKDWIPPLTPDAHRAVILRRARLGQEAFAPNITVELRPIDTSNVTALERSLPKSLVIAHRGSDDTQTLTAGARLSVALWGSDVVMQLEHWVPSSPAGALLWVVCSALDAQWPELADEFEAIAASALLTQQDGAS